MRNLFVYGPLVSRELMDDISGCILPRQRGTLRGYSCHNVKGTEYKGIILKEGGEVQGAVYYNVPRTSFERIVRYFGEIYIIDTVVVELIDGKVIETEVFIVKPHCAVMLDLDKEVICKIIDTPLI